MVLSALLDKHFMGQLLTKDLAWMSPFGTFVCYIGELRCKPHDPGKLIKSKV